MYLLSVSLMYNKQKLLEYVNVFQMFLQCNFHSSKTIIKYVLYQSFEWLTKSLTTITSFANSIDSCYSDERLSVPVCSLRFIQIKILKQFTFCLIPSSEQDNEQFLISHMILIPYRQTSVSIARKSGLVCFDAVYHRLL